jgi:hypothetical protein
VNSTALGAAATPTYQFYSGCPGVDGNLYTPLNAEASNSAYKINGTELTYRIFCKANFAASGSGSNPGVTDLQVLFHTATLDDCIIQCASYNYALSVLGSPSWNQLCSGVGYASPQSNPFNIIACFLKSGLRNNATNVTVGGGEQDSAVLQWPGES